MPAPAFDPSQRDPARVAPADTYRRHDPVWVYRDGAWHAGVVDSASAFAVLVTYERPGARGTVVDTVTPEFVVRHTDPDPAGPTPGPAGGPARGPGGGPAGGDR